MANWRTQGAQLARPAAGLAIGAFAVTTTASLLLERALPPDDGLWTWSSVILLGILLAVGGFLAREYRQFRSRAGKLADTIEQIGTATGTLYSVHLQLSGVSDLHAEAIHNEDRLDYKFIGARVEDAPILDVAVECHEIHTELERSVNEDTDEHAYTVVPNLIAPAGLSVGYQWFPRPRTLLREIDQGAASFEFTLEDVSARAQSLGLTSKTPVDRRTNRTDSAPADPPDLAGIAVVDRRNNRWKTPPAHPRIDNDVQAVHLSVVIGRGPGIGGAVTTWIHNTDSENSAECDVVRVVSPLTDPPEGTDSGRSELRGVAVVRPGAAAGPGEVAIDNAVIAAGYWIQRTVIEFPNATIFLMLRIPKTATVALGWYLATIRPAIGDVRAGEPWERLVPLTFVEGGGLRPTHAHPAQRRVLGAASGDPA
ncbi:hypothetical protein [Millisia brevis]|uniref:hypothetical protein n=1 Tax=Millisia brevis TaxID=264148 RepID=UPI0008326376|nr:hypothetical protein [Millisia brevis]